MLSDITVPSVFVLNRCLSNSLRNSWMNMIDGILNVMNDLKVSYFVIVQSVFNK